MRTKEHNEKIAEALCKRNEGVSMTKMCPRCKKTFLRTDFGLRKVCNSAGVRLSKSYCKLCENKYSVQRQNRHIARHPELKLLREQYNRKAQWKRKYGMTVENYDEFMKSQGGVCAICKKKQTVKGKGFLYVDHDHKTNIVRGLLCGPCNSLLGYAQDSVEILQDAILYLDTNK